jgi:hypothetical protein
MVFICNTFLHFFFLLLLIHSYVLEDIIYWVENGEMSPDALVSVPNTMQEILGDNWVEAQTLIDTQIMSEYRKWRKDDDDFQW